MDLQEKKAFRKQMLAKRDALTTEYRDEADAARTARLRQEAWFREAEVLLFYVSYRSEADTRTLLGTAFAEGKMVAVPKVMGTEMEFFRITSMEQLKEGYRGILEPDETCERFDEVPLSQEAWKTDALDRKGHNIVLLVPGCAFDEKGGRMGYGGGFYDRFMERYPELMRVALAYEIQLVPEVPKEPHDKPVDVIVTETRIIRTNGEA